MQLDFSVFSSSWIEMSFHYEAHFTMVSFRVDFLPIVISIVQFIISDSYPIIFDFTTSKC